MCTVLAVHDAVLRAASEWLVWALTEAPRQCGFTMDMNFVAPGEGEGWGSYVSFTVSYHQSPSVIIIDHQ